MRKYIINYISHDIMSHDILHNTTVVTVNEPINNIKTELVTLET